MHRAEARHEENVCHEVHEQAKMHREGRGSERLPGAPDHAGAGAPFPGQPVVSDGTQGSLGHLLHRGATCKACSAERKLLPGREMGTKLSGCRYPFECFVELCSLMAVLCSTFPHDTWKICSLFILILFSYLMNREMKIDF
ncbi:unnamed protein product, partial [Gulo gulo]